MKLVLSLLPVLLFLLARIAVAVGVKNSIVEPSEDGAEHNIEGHETADGESNESRELVRILRHGILQKDEGTH